MAVPLWRRGAKYGMMLESFVGVGEGSQWANSTTLVVTTAAFCDVATRLINAFGVIRRPFALS